jgi:hypothetical protein
VRVQVQLWRRIMSAHRTFLESAYSLMRFLEAEMTRRGWDLVRNGGYGITRNGGGRGLANFATADWVVSQISIAFMASGKATVAPARTDIPTEGLEVLLFQVRWLDKSPSEPVVWRARLFVEPEGAAAPRKWEEYQTLVLNRLEPLDRVDGQRSGNIKPGKAVIAGASVVFRGTYVEVPVADILAAADVVSQLIDLP